MDVIRHELMQRCLKKGNEYSYRDKSIFNLWSIGKISTQEALDRFAKNNYISLARLSQVDETLFIEWLKSIGWERRVNHESSNYNWQNF